MNAAAVRQPAQPLGPVAHDPDLHKATQVAEHPHCVVCGAANPAGLRLEFVTRKTGLVTAEFTADSTLEGYPGRLHGGIIAALVDGAMTNCLFSMGIPAVTAELSVRYPEAVRVDRPTEITAWWLRTRGHLYAMQAEIRQDDGVVVRAPGKFMDKRRSRALSDSAQGADRTQGG